MGEQNGALAAVALDVLAHIPKEFAESLFFADGSAVAVVQIDAGHLQGSLVDGGTGKRLHRPAQPLVDAKFSVMKAERHGGNVENPVPVGIEAAGFDIDRHGQKPAEAARHDVFDHALT